MLKNILVRIGASGLNFVKILLACPARHHQGNTKDTPRATMKRCQSNLPSLASAEVLMDKDRMRTKSEFDSAREKFLAETLSDEVKADTRGFLQYMGGHCNNLRKNHPVPLPKPAS